MRNKKCRVLVDGVHLATVWYLDDNRWTLEQQEAHLPITMLEHVRLFDSYVGLQPPPLVNEWVTKTGIQLDTLDPIGTLLSRGGGGPGVRFVR